ncbi:HD domain-containing protein [bacterium]|nr:HD domain-containing protein [bacterium]
MKADAQTDRNLLDRSGILPPGFSDEVATFGRSSGVSIFSLRWKVSISFSVLLFMVVGLLFFAFMRYERIFLQREGEKRAQSLALNLAVNARDPLLAQDDLRLGPVTESISQDSDVLYAFLMDHQSRVLYHSDPVKTGKLLPQGVPMPEKGVIQVSVPVVVEEVQVGTAVVGLSEDHIREAVAATAIGLIFPLSVGTGLGLLGIFFLTGVHINRVELLEKAVQALGSGNLQVRVDDRSMDEVGRLSRGFNEMVTQLHMARKLVEKNFKETISALAEAVEAKDAYTRGHCDRVARISLAIAKRAGLETARCMELELAAILHDIGKIGVEEGVVGKLGPLNPDETRDMRHHPEIGARILSPLSSLKKVGSYVKHHHEHYDGTGYPNRLKGEKIPLPSRIILLADAFDAMTTDRPYREALTRKEAFQRINLGRGNQFDPRIVDIFFALADEGYVDAVYGDDPEEAQPSNA